MKLFVAVRIVGKRAVADFVDIRRDGVNRQRVSDAEGKSRAVKDQILLAPRQNRPGEFSVAPLPLLRGRVSRLQVSHLIAGGLMWPRRRYVGRPPDDWPVPLTKPQAPYSGLRIAPHDNTRFP